MMIMPTLQILNAVLTMAPIAAQTSKDIKRMFTSDPAVRAELEKVIAETVSTDDQTIDAAKKWLAEHGA